MKVLVVTHETDLSGANKSLISLIEKLSDRVHFDVIVNKESGKLIDILKTKNIHIIYHSYSWCYAYTRVSMIKRIYRRIFDGVTYYLKKIKSKDITKYLTEKEYDLIYSNTSVIDFGIIIAKKLNIPHIWHMREFGKEDFGLQKICSSKYYKNIYSSSDSIIAISKAIANKYEKIIPKENIRVVYNGFNIKDLLAPLHKHKSSNDKIKILVVGQVCAAKGQNQAIMACKILKEKGYNIELHLVGGVDNDYINKSISNVDDINWLMLHGMVEDVYSIRSEMDIELVCSRNEAFGRVTIEAMLHGIPVIASNTGGTPELIVNEKNGMLYEFEDYKQLAKNIERYIEDEKFYNYVAINAQKYAKEFTIEKTAESVLNIFNEFIK